jgi:membrane associated rhomboid family serine protease
MVTTSGFTHTPTSRALILSHILLSTIASITSSKHLLPLKPTPHLWPYLQFSRLLTYQLASTSAVEVLVTTVLLYQFRVLERVWGSRKYTSLMIVVGLLDVVVVPGLCVMLKLLSWGQYNYVPAGLTGCVFAGLAAWTEEVPRLYRYKILTPTRTGGNGSAAEAPGVVLSDKSTTYLLAAQLALSQFPYQIIPAAIGWLLGSAWCGDLLPARMGRWRVPGWVVGDNRKKGRRGEYEGLRRRLEEEGSAADGMRNVSDQRAREGETQENRGFWGSVSGYFTGTGT